MLSLPNNLIVHHKNILKLHPDWETLLRKGDSLGSSGSGGDSLAIEALFYARVHAGIETPNSDPNAIFPNLVYENFRLPFSCGSGFLGGKSALSALPAYVRSVSSGVRRVVADHWRNVQRLGKNKLSPFGTT